MNEQEENIKKLQKEIDRINKELMLLVNTTDGFSVFYIPVLNYGVFKVELKKPVNNYELLKELKISVKGSIFTQLYTVGKHEGWRSFKIDDAEFGKISVSRQEDYKLAMFGVGKDNKETIAVYAWYNSGIDIGSTVDDVSDVVNKWNDISMWPGRIIDGYGNVVYLDYHVIK